jgi:hypothetical protein
MRGGVLAGVVPVNGQETIDLHIMQASIAAISEKLGGHIDRAEQIYQEAREERRWARQSIEGLRNQVHDLNLIFTERKAKAQGGWGVITTLGAVIVAVVTFMLALANDLIHWKGNP